MALINDVYFDVQQIANKSQAGGFISPSRYNTFIALAQLDCINELQQLIGFNQRVIGLAKSVLKTQNISVSTSGYANTPSDYYLYADSNALYYENGAFDIYPIDYVDKSERGERKRSKVVNPTKEYPIASEGFSGLLIEPTTISQIEITYFYAPPVPVWAGSGTPPVFDPSASTDLVLGNDFRNVLAAKVCAYLGVNIRDQFLYSTQTVKGLIDIQTQQ